QELDAVFIFAGATTSSRLQMYTDEIAKHHTALREHENIAREIVESPEPLAELSVSELRAKKAVLKGFQVVIQRIHTKFERNYDTYLEQNSKSRERSLNR
ncbi:MAG: hypothetical protein O7F71_15000, partial [Gammaproteobacteria bacterium]|nr:hypothetical protein [Gammaproteobacteria bacterium]